jgi:catechol 2,3-dioxygenase-like lactoylglutathione lyase family enzyme
MDKLEYHHTGLLVENIEKSLDHYLQIFGEDNISEIYNIKSQKVRVCLIKNGRNSYLELVEPINNDSSLKKMLKKRISYYHVAYIVKNIDDALKFLENLNYKALEVFNSEAFNGRSCVFLYSPDAHLIELIEE